MDFKKAIKELKKENVHCWRESDKVFWVTDTYFLIRMDQEQFNLFKSKYSSLKRNAYIPDLDIGQSVATYGKKLRKKAADINALFEDDEKLEIVEMPDISIGDLELYYGENFLGCLKKDNSEVFRGNLAKSKGKLSIVWFYNEENEIIGAIMPVRPEIGQISEDFRKINKILESRGDNNEN